MSGRVWTCDECGRRDKWDRKWSHLFLGGPCAVFCSDDCCGKWLDRTLSVPPLANYHRDGRLR